MFRMLASAAFTAQAILRPQIRIAQKLPKLTPLVKDLPISMRLFGGFQPGILQETVAKVPLAIQTRTVTKFSMRSGKRKTVKAVLKRFYRLNWGGWIRTRSGRHKKMWRKTANRKHRLRQHVFVSGTQAWLLDSCVTKFWRRPKYYAGDIYEPYHTRNEFFATKNTKIYE